MLSSKVKSPNDTGDEWSDIGHEERGRSGEGAGGRSRGTERGRSGEGAGEKI